MAAPVCAGAGAMPTEPGHATLKASVAAESRESDRLVETAPSTTVPIVTPTGKGEGAGGFHALVVGAGLSGAVMARELAEKGKRVLVIDKRHHLAGNCYDYIDKTGFRVAEYGPHFFHTASDRVWAFVNRFSEWTPWEHRVTARVDPTGDLHVPVPCNITTVNKLFGLAISNETEMNAWLAAEQVPCAAPKDSRDVALSRVGHRLYDLLFKGYTRKQWAKWPEELEPSVLARIPVRNNFDDRYFTDPYQALPRHGYTAFISSVFDHPNIEVRTNTDFFAEGHALRTYEKLYYTGPIDRYYVHLGYDPLEYRSCIFTTETVSTSDDGVIQPTSQVNYPSHHVPYTRITEYKHLPNQATASGRLSTPCSVLVKEFSTDKGDPFYPVPAPANRSLYERYKAATATERDVVFVGRLASYKYFNMDAAILNALECADYHVHGRGTAWPAA